MGDEIKMAEGDDNTSFMDDEMYKIIQSNQRPSELAFGKDEAYLNELFVARTRGAVNNNVLHVAAQYGNRYYIECAINNKAFHGRFDLLFGRNLKGEIPLHLAVQSGDMETIETLVDLPTSLGDHEHMREPYLCTTDNQGDTPLHTALRYGRQDVALFLLETDPKLAYLPDNKAGESLAYLAAETLCERFLHTILDSASNSQSSISFSGPFGMTVFHAARKLNDDIMLALIKRRKDLLKQQDNKGKTVLHYVVEDAIEPMVYVLLKADSSLAFVHDDDGMTPLHRASSMGSFPIVRRILKLCPQSILMICDKGEHAGQTPLHVAKMDASFFKLCLRHTIMKKLVNVVDNEGNTPLHLALKQNSLAQDVANALLEVSGIDWRLKNNEGYTPMDLCKYDNTANLVVSKESMKGDLVEKTPKSIDNIPSNLKRLTSENWRAKEEINLESNKLVDWRSYRGVEGETVVHLAASEGDMAMIKDACKLWDISRILLLSGLNSKAETPLHVAAAAGKLQVVEAILNLSISTDKLGNKKPVQVGVAIETSNADAINDDGNRTESSNAEWKPWKMKSAQGDTPLHSALRNRYEEVAMRLLECDPSLKYSSVNKMNESPLYLASLTGCSKVVRLLTASENNQDNKRISTGGPDGQNALHAAIRRPRETLPAEVFSNVPSFNYDKSSVDKSNGLHQVQADYLDATTEDLAYNCSWLLAEVDNDGKTPLHYAIELDNFYVWLPCIRFGGGRYIPQALLVSDNEGFTPLLRAAANGSVNCIILILELHYVSAVEVRHAGNDSTMLHLFKITSDYTHKAWVQIMTTCPKLKTFINKIDKDGNTPLHYAILESDIKKTRFLLSIDGVRLSIQNKWHQTPIDLCTQLLTKGDSRQLAIWIALEDFLAKEKKRRNAVPLLLRINTHVMTSYGGLGMSSDEDLKKLLENIAVAAALLITLSFAATFTIPGGYDGDTGQALRMKEASVKTFVASNVVAMLLGVGALLTYTFGATKKAWLRVLSIPCVVMLQCALLATIVSFISGVYALVFKDANWIATLAVAIVGCVLLLFSITPAAAGAVIQIINWFQKCLEWLVRGGKTAFVYLLVVPFYLARYFHRFDIESKVKRLADRVGESTTRV